jgi:ubiquinone/menaquinone biosynthesis C-methylase UbiE
VGDRRPDQRPERLPAGPDLPLIDPAAATFEAVADEYDLGRPTWPDAAVEAAGLPREAAVADLGAGTGKLTRVLLGHFDRVIAIEPLDGMRRLIPPAADVRAGTAEAIPLADKSLDGVF